MGSNVPIFLSIVNKFHYFIMNFDRPTSIIAFGGKMKQLFFLLATVILPEAHLSVCKLLHQFYSNYALVKFVWLYTFEGGRNFYLIKV